MRLKTARLPSFRGTRTLLSLTAMAVIALGTGTVASAASAATAPPRCLTSQLSGALTHVNGTTGSVYSDIQLTNNSGLTCSLFGYPGVVLAKDGHQVGHPAKRVRGVPENLVVLRPGHSANAQFQVVFAQNYDPSVCRPVATHKVWVIPPNDYTHLVIRHDFTACANPTVHLLFVSPYA